MNYLSLFSGIGGLDLGLDRAGMTCVGQVELDPFCRSVLAHHWPEVPRHDDIRTAGAWWVGQHRPTVDLVCGGFPCQPVSQAGDKLAQADARWLWPHMADVLAVVRPGWVIAENVPGLLRRGFDDVLRDLAALRFDAEWDCVPAASIGAPHVRDRVFIVANAQGVRWRAGRPGRPDPSPQDGPRLAPAGLADPEGGRREGGAELPRVDRIEPGGRDSGNLEHSGSPGLQGRRVFGATPDAVVWPAEPRIRRVAHGVPRQVDRLRSLGNAVVPAVAEHVGRLVMAAAA